MKDWVIDMNDWRSGMVGRYVLHEASRTIGKVRHVYEPGEYRSDKQSYPVTTHVIEFALDDGVSLTSTSRGHAFIAMEQSDFKVLSESEVSFYALCRMGVATMVRECAQWAAANKLTQDQAADVISHVLGEQAARLRK